MCATGLPPELVNLLASEWTVCLQYRNLRLILIVEAEPVCFD